MKQTVMKLCVLPKTNMKRAAALPSRALLEAALGKKASYHHKSTHIQTMNEVPTRMAADSGDAAHIPTPTVFVSTII